MTGQWVSVLRRVAPPRPTTATRHRHDVTSHPRAGKFLVAGDEKFVPKGVSYGTFAPDARGGSSRPSARWPTTSP